MKITLLLGITCFDIVLMPIYVNIKYHARIFILNMASEGTGVGPVLMRYTTWTLAGREMKLIRTY